MPIGYHHLIRDQRSQIYALKSNGLKQTVIAAHLKVHPSTLSRELNRNCGLKGYCFHQADVFATERRRTASSQPKRMIPAVVKIVEEKIQAGWSPEQISGRLKLEVSINVSHESIYQHVWSDKKQGVVTRPNPYPVLSVLYNKSSYPHAIKK